LSLLLLLVLGCTPKDGPADSPADSADDPTTDCVRPEQTSPDVVFVVVDTLRADHLPPYGYPRDTAPHFSAWAEDAALFEQAVSQGGWTVPAVSAMLTGLYPSSTGGLSGTIHDGFDLMAERFQSAGYLTAALTKSSVYSAAAGYAQGFETFTFIQGDHRSGRSAEELSDAALAWLEAEACVDAPRFLFLHYLDPHVAYEAPEPWLERFDEGGSDVCGDEQTIWSYQSGEATPSEADLARLVALYDGEIAWWDEQLGRLLAALPEGTAVIVAGDHGEQFLDHGGWVHEDLWQENLHVPLAIQWPGAAPRRVSGRVQTADLLPTLAGLLGWPPDARWQGRDLSGVVAGDEEPPSATIYSQYNERSAVIDEAGWKLIRERDGDPSQDRLYDLSADPGEREDRSADAPEALARLRGLAETLRDESAAILAAMESTDEAQRR